MKFEGILPALITPLNEDETINTAVLTDLVEHLLGQNVDGFYVAGATGEGIALCPEQRMLLAETTVKTVNKRKSCIIHIASTNFQDAVRLAKHAEQIGADAISAIPPMFFQYDEDDVFAYYKRLAESVSIPLMIYYNPAAGFSMNAEFAARAFQVDNITAIKWTSSNYYEMLKLKDLTHGEMNIINGPDEMLLMGLSAGADGGIGTSYNIIPGHIKAVYDNFRSNNMEAAYAAQQAADRIISCLLQYKLIPAIKVVLEEMGFAVGNCTFPMKVYTARQKQEIITGLKAAGLLF